MGMLGNLAKLGLAKKGFDPLMGARPMARVINNEIKKPLSKLLIAGPLKSGGEALVSVKDGALVVEPKEDKPLLLTDGSR